MVGRIGLLVCVLLATACTRLNADHCGNRHGNATCEANVDDRPFCSVCEASFDGCVKQAPEDPSCLFAGDVASTDTGTTATSVASQESSSASSITVSTTTAAETSTTETSAATTSMSASSESTGGRFCGDDVKNGDEVCDGDDLDGLSCEMLNLGTGMLACEQDCSKFDVTGCMNVAVCGNGEIEGNEDCDGENLDGMTCAAFQMFASGALSCDQFCMFNTTNCVDCKTAAMGCMDSAECCTENCNGLGVCL